MFLVCCLVQNKPRPQIRFKYERFLLTKSYHRLAIAKFPKANMKNTYQTNTKLIVKQYKINTRRVALAQGASHPREGKGLN